MIIKNVIKKVATMLQLNNVANVNFDSAEIDTQTQKDINLILSCINIVLCDIATDYLPLKYTETITVENGSFALSGLTKDFHKLIKVDTHKEYKVIQENLIIENGTYSVTYSYLPSEYTVSGTISGFDKRLTINALCFGVAGEFCLVSGNYSESEMWNSRFENAMQTAKRKLTMPKLKERRWI